MSSSHSRWRNLSPHLCMQTFASSGSFRQSTELGEMKLCRGHGGYVQTQVRGRRMPEVDGEELERILKGCGARREVRQSMDTRLEFHAGKADRNGGSGQCPACDGTFFPLLLKEMKDVVGHFNKQVQKLLALHLQSGFHKYVLWAKGNNLHRHNDSIIQQCHGLVNYAMVSSMKARKLLKLYDKVHDSKKGQAFQSRVQTMHLEILQSPWFCELMALYINIQKNDRSSVAISGVIDDCSLTFNDGKPLLSCGLFDSLKLNIDLTCSICLDTVFDIVSLSCGHIFCYMCACSAASVSVVDGLKSADPRSKCPLCRQAGVYEGSVRLNELNNLLSQSCNEYWKQRLQMERVERLQRAKEHWQSQCQAFMGF